jgi:nitrilase
LKILAYQPRINRVKTVEDRRSHVRNIAQNLEAQCRQNPDVALILLPELSTVEYSAASFANLANLAEPLEGETFIAISALAKRLGCAISYGFPQVKEGKFYISQVVVGSSAQLLTTYNKLHLAHIGVCMEKDYFSRGDSLSVFELGGFRIGTIICYDFRFSDLLKKLAFQHAVDVILHPVAFAKDGTFASWHHFVITRALEYQVYFLSLNRAGPMYGNSILCPPWIDDQTSPLILGDNEEACVFTLDKQVIHSARETYHFREDMLADYSILKNGGD